jgi:outer membrane lipoprotein-sorting protein
MRPAENIERFVKETPITTNPKVNDAVLGDLLDRLDKAEGAPTAAAQPNRWRFIMKSNVFRVAAAAAMIAIVAVVGSQFVSGTNAYAQIVQEIKSARTMVYTLIRQANTGTGETIKVDVAYKEPGSMRVTTVDGYIAILDASSGKMMSIVPQGRYSTGDLSSLQSKFGSGPFANIEAMKALPAKADQNLGTKEIDGVDVEGYSVTQGDATTIVWIAAKSGDLVQVEHKYASAPGMNTIMKNIKLDVPLEDSLFSLTPPAGFTPFRTELKSSDAAQTEETFVTFLGWWANGNTDETFPPMVAGSELAKVVMDMGNQGKLKGESWQNVPPQQMFNALLFVATLPKESNWRYAGNGVKISTPDTPIFWYRPAGSELYRVFYADLTIKEVAESDLPK